MRESDPWICRYALWHLCSETFESLFLLVQIDAQSQFAEDELLSVVLLKVIHSPIEILHVLGCTPQAKHLKCEFSERLHCNHSVPVSSNNLWALEYKPIYYFWSISGFERSKSWLIDLHLTLLFNVSEQNGRKVICGSQEGVLLLYSWGHFADCRFEI